MTDRLSSYKNRGKTSDLHKRIQQDVIELRKARKDDQLSKRRNIPMLDDPEYESDENEDFPSLPQEKTMTLPEIQAGLTSPDPDIVLEATRSSRKILSKEANAPINDFIDAGLLPIFVGQLNSESCALQFESAWVLTNVASGNESQTTKAIEAGTAVEFIRLLQSSALNVVEQVLWGLANIAGTNAGYRDMLLNMGILPILIRLIDQVPSKALYTTASWCISNLCRRMNKAPAFQSVKKAVPVLCKLLESDSLNVVSDACWALSYFTDSPGICLKWACDCGVVAPLVKLISTCEDKSIVIPALRSLGNIVTGDVDETQAVLNANALPLLRRLLENQNGYAKKEIVWMLSNILAGTSSQIGAVISEGFLPLLRNMLIGDDYKCRVEAAWAFCNLTCAGSLEQISDLIRTGCLQPLVGILKSNDTRLMQAILDAIGNTLKTAHDVGLENVVLTELEEAGFVEEIEMLQMHENQEIYRRAAAIVTNYWSSDSVTESRAEIIFEPTEPAMEFAL